MSTYHFESGKQIRSDPFGCIVAVTPDTVAAKRATRMFCMAAGHLVILAMWNQLAMIKSGVSPRLGIRGKRGHGCLLQMLLSLLLTIIVLGVLGLIITFSL